MVTLFGPFLWSAYLTSPRDRDHDGNDGMKGAPGSCFRIERRLLVDNMVAKKGTLLGGAEWFTSNPDH